MALPAGDNAPRPMALILRSRPEQLRSLDAIHTGLAVTAAVAVFLAILLSFAVARTITRPLAAITDVMREVAATGDLARKKLRRRSEEHTSELQSHSDLVCRLLLEKKKKQRR